MSEIKVKHGTGFVGIIGNFSNFNQWSKVGTIQNGDEACTFCGRKKRLFMAGAAPMRTKW